MGSAGGSAAATNARCLAAARPAAASRHTQALCLVCRRFAGDPVCAARPQRDRGHSGQERGACAAVRVHLCFDRLALHGLARRRQGWLAGSALPPRPSPAAPAARLPRRRDDSPSGAPPRPLPPCQVSVSLNREMAPRQGEWSLREANLPLEQNGTLQARWVACRRGPDGAVHARAGAGACALLAGQRLLCQRAPLAPLPAIHALTAR